MNLEQMDETKLRSLIRETVKDVLEEELMKLRLLLAPAISENEQLEIEEAYGEPTREMGRTLSLREE